MSRLVPSALASSLVAEIGRQAEQIDWDSLTQSQKTAALNRWVHDQRIGGKLRPLVGGDAEVRLWLKDVALKLRARAQGPEPESVAEWVFGGAASVALESVGIKPHHGVVRDANGDRHYFCWGPPESTKHLVWAAMNAHLDDPACDTTVVVLERRSAPTGRDRMVRLQALAKRCGVRIMFRPDESRGAG